MLLIFINFLFLPLFIAGCMRTPDIPGGPSIPITVAPPTIAPVTPSITPPITPPVTPPVTPDPCPIPPGTAMIFIMNGIDLTDEGGFGMATPAQSCATATGTNRWYNGDTPLNPNGVMDGAVGSWQRSMCAAPCMCDGAGECYIPNTPGDPDNVQDPAITFYPHCPTPTTCFIAPIMRTGGVLTPTNGGMDIDSEDQLNMDADLLDVTDPSYPKIISVGCGGCPVMTT